MIEKTTRRLTLHELLNHTEKYTHALGKHVRSSMWRSLTSFRELSRPDRKQSSYPTLVAFRNGLDDLRARQAELDDLIAYVKQRFDEILEHANREQGRR